MASNFFHNLKLGTKSFLIENKWSFLILLIVIIFGIYVGIYNAVALKEDLEISNMTDIAFIGFIDDDWSWFNFFLNRFCYLCFPLILTFFVLHWISLPLIVFFNFAKAYFFAFNLMIMFFNLKLVGLFYLFLVAIPCFLLYCLILLPCYCLIIKNIILKCKFKTGRCQNHVENKFLIKFLIISLIVNIVIIIYEATFLFFIFNKYLFSI